MSAAAARPVVRPARLDDLGSTLDLLMIDVGHHRQGLGRVLLAWVEERLFSWFTAIRCETFDGNASAVAFYEACGWAAASRTESDDGLPARIEFVKARPARARPAGGAGRPTLNR